MYCKITPSEFVEKTVTDLNHEKHIVSLETPLVPRSIASRSTPSTHSREEIAFMLVAGNESRFPSDTVLTTSFFKPFYEASP